MIVHAFAGTDIGIEEQYSAHHYSSSNTSRWVGRLRIRDVNLTDWADSRASVASQTEGEHQDRARNCNGRGEGVAVGHDQNAAHTVADRRCSFRGRNGNMAKS